MPSQPVTSRLTVTTACPHRLDTEVGTDEVESRYLPGRVLLGIPRRRLSQWRQRLPGILLLWTGQEVWRCRSVSSFLRRRRLDGTDRNRDSACANGDLVSPIPHPEQQCVSSAYHRPRSSIEYQLTVLADVCDTTAKLCGAPPPAGMPIGSGCGNPSVCASGTCTNSLCAAAAPVPSAAKKTKRYVLNGSGPNVNSCPQGQTACSVGEGPLAGFEVRRVLPLTSSRYVLMMRWFQCIDSQVNLERCGGCITDGLGEDCTAISGVESVMCDVGKCLVRTSPSSLLPRSPTHKSTSTVSCGPGLDISVNGASCVPAYRF
jgi:hypothetical protein